MTSADEFEKRIKKATKKGIGSSLKKAGRTAPIAAALRAYEESGARGEAQAERAAYLYQVIKNCNAWSRLKAGETGGNTENRRRVIVALYNEAQLELRQYPLIAHALNEYARRKGGGAKATTGLKDVYAHEGAAYRNLKAQGQFVDPGQPRFAPSATLIHGVGASDPRTGDTAYANGRVAFKNLSFEEFVELDRLLNSQYQVLYLSKVQRVKHMVAIEDGKFYWAVDGSTIDMAGQSVELDLGLKGGGVEYPYACDRYGNVFIVPNNQTAPDGTKLQVNHSTMLAGNEVLCAGTISIKKGVLRAVSNLSGHYAPDTEALKAFITELRDVEGVSVNRAIVVDKKLGITTTGVRFMDGNARDYEKEAAIGWALRAAG
jgi:hypothetical protein